MEKKIATTILWERMCCGYKMVCKCSAGEEQHEEEDSGMILLLLLLLLPAVFVSSVWFLVCGGGFWSVGCK